MPERPFVGHAPCPVPVGEVQHRLGSRPRGRERAGEVGAPCHGTLARGGLGGSSPRSCATPASSLPWTSRSVEPQLLDVRPHVSQRVAEVSRHTKGAGLCGTSYQRCPLLRAEVVPDTIHASLASAGDYRSATSVDRYHFSVCACLPRESAGWGGPPNRVLSARDAAARPLPRSLAPDNVSRVRHR
jgi:hypothetical protein